MPTGRIIGAFSSGLYRVRVSSDKRYTWSQYRDARYRESSAFVLHNRYQVLAQRLLNRFTELNSRMGFFEAFLRDDAQRVDRVFDPLDTSFSIVGPFKSLGGADYAQRELDSLSKLVTPYQVESRVMKQAADMERLKLKIAVKESAQHEAEALALRTVEIYSRDCSDLSVNDAVLVIALDPRGERLVLHPDKISSDYFYRLNEFAEVVARSYAQVESIRAQIDFFKDWLSEESGLPDRPPSFRNFASFHGSAMQVENLTRAIAGYQAQLDKYELELDDSEISDARRVIVQMACDNLINIIGQLNDDLDANEQIFEAQSLLSESPFWVGYRNDDLVDFFVNELEQLALDFIFSENQLNSFLSQYGDFKSSIQPRLLSDNVLMGYGSNPRASSLIGQKSMAGATWFVNAAIQFAHQKWKPFFVVGEVLSLSSGQVVIKPSAVSKTIDGRAIDLRSPDYRSNIVIDALDFDYEAGDQALINITPDGPKAFGWFANPPCIGDYMRYAFFPTGEGIIPSGVPKSAAKNRFLFGGPLPQFFSDNWNGGEVYQGFTADGKTRWVVDEVCECFICEQSSANGIFSEVDRFEFNSVVNFDPSELNDFYFTGSVRTGESSLKLATDSTRFQFFLGSNHRFFVTESSSGSILNYEGEIVRSRSGGRFGLLWHRGSPLSYFYHVAGINYNGFTNRNDIPGLKVSGLLIMNLITGQQQVVNHSAIPLTSSFDTTLNTSGTRYLYHFAPFSTGDIVAACIWGRRQNKIVNSFGAESWETVFSQYHWVTWQDGVLSSSYGLSDNDGSLAYQAANSALAGGVRMICRIGRDWFYSPANHRLYNIWTGQVLKYFQTGQPTALVTGVYQNYFDLGDGFFCVESFDGSPSSHRHGPREATVFYADPTENPSNVTFKRFNELAWLHLEKFPHVVNGGPAFPR